MSYLQWMEASHLGHGLSSFDQQLATPLAQRMRIALVGLGACVVLFAIGDSVWNADLFARLLPFKSLQLGAVIGAFAALGRPWSFRATCGLGVAFVAAFAFGVAGQAVVRADTSTAALALVGVVLGHSVLIPAGLRAQLAVVGVSALASLSTVLIVGDDPWIVGSMPALVLWTLAAFSILIAQQDERLRLAVIAKEHELRQRADEATALATFARDMMSTMAKPVLLERLCELTVHYLDCDYSHAFLLDEEGRFRAVAAFGESAERWQELQVMSFEPELIGELLRELDSQDVIPLGRDMSGPAIDAFPAGLPEALGWEYMLLMPLRRHGELFGLHVAGNARCAEFSPSALRIAGGIARIGSMALENSRLVEELNQASSAKDEFFASMSHELRNPLNVIIGYHELLADGAFDPLTEAQRETVDRLQMQSRDLLRMINAVLDLSRDQAAGSAVVLTDLDARSFLEDLRRTCSKPADAESVAMEWMVAEALPPVRTDPEKLKVILDNLIRNAVKFTAEGRICIAVQPAPDGLEFTVADTGIGIAEDARERIFEAFRQADGTVATRFGGAGLGLHIARRMADILGARIDLESTEGKGSTFRVLVPHDPPSDSLRAERSAAS